jgi:hypothetical protein
MRNLALLCMVAGFVDGFGAAPHGSPMARAWRSAALRGATPNPLAIPTVLLLILAVRLFPLGIPL